MSPTEAIKKLREHLGDSQQAFATRLGMSIRAIANYEKDREPRGEPLFALIELAEKSKRPDLAGSLMATFYRQTGVGENLGKLLSQAKDDGTPTGYLFMRFDGSEAIDFAYAFYRPMMALLHYSTKPETKALARKLLRNFQKNVDEAWGAK